MVLRLVAVAAAAVFAYGLAETQPWAHSSWTLPAFERFAIASAIAVALSLLVKRGWFYSLIIAYACFAVGIRPVFALALLLLGAVNLGGLLFKSLDDRLNLLSGFAVYVWFFSLTASLPIHTAWLWLALTVIPIAAGRHVALPCPKPSAWIAVPLMANFLMALKPEVSADGLGQHLVIVEWVRDYARFHFDAANHIWSVQPMAGDWALTIAGLLGSGEAAARLLNYVWLLLLVSFVHTALRRRLDRTPAAICTAVFAAVPLLSLTTTSLFIENFWAAMVTGALFAIEQGEIVLAAALLGASAASKLLGLTPSFGLGLYALWRLRPRFPWRKTLLPAAAIFLAIAVVPYARAWLITGNPVFHYANAFFKSPLMRSDESFVDSRYPARLTPTTLYDVTFHTNWFVESEPGTAGYQWLFLAPLALVAMRRSSASERAALATALSMVILVFSRQASVRYVEAALPLLLIGSASTIAALLEDRWLRYPAAAAGVLLFALNLYQLPGASTYHRDFCFNPFQWDTDRERYLDAIAPDRKLIDAVNRAGKPNATVALIEGDAVAGLRGRSWTSTWHTPKFADRLRVTRSVAAYAALARDFQIDYWIAPAPGHYRYLEHSALAVYLESCCTRIAAAGNLQLLKPDRMLVPQRSEVAGPGVYDDANVAIDYEGEWMLDQSFAAAAGGTVSYSSDANAAIRFAFTGDRITYVFTKAFNRAHAAISIDGSPRGVFDLASSDPQWQSKLVFDHLGPGTHEIVIRSAGPAGRYLDLDQLIVE